MQIVLVNFATQAMLLATGSRQGFPQCTSRLFVTVASKFSNKYTLPSILTMLGHVAVAEELVNESRN